MLTQSEVDAYMAETRANFWNRKFTPRPLADDELGQVITRYRERFREWNALSKDEQKRRLARRPHRALPPQYVPEPEVPIVHRGPSIEGLFREACSRALKRGLEWSLTLDEYIVLRADACCHYCQGPLNKGGSAIDRLNPAVGYVPGNVVPCCWVCNNVKGTNFTPDEMRRIGKVIARIRGRWSPTRKSRAWRNQARQPSLL